MDPVRNVQNQNPFAVKSKPTRSVPGRNPLTSFENKTRNLPIKTSFKESLSLKDNTRTRQVKSIREQLAAKREALQNVAELQMCLPNISYSSNTLPDNIEDIDLDDTENPQLVSCYVKDIYTYLKVLEARYPIRRRHLQLQSEINGKMRSVLIDWLVQVHLRFHLLQETLYMTVSIIDRFLQADYVRRSQLQLVGVTAMFIASKYEEIYVPDISDLVYITDETYEKKDILAMEKCILKTLEFNLSKPLPLHFLRRNSKAGNVDAKIHTLAKYVMELTLPEYEFAHILPSCLAAASLLLSLKILTNANWSETLLYYTSYKEADLLPVVKKMCRIVMDSEKSTFQAIRSKYSSRHFNRISTISPLKSSAVVSLAKTKK